MSIVAVLSIAVATKLAISYAIFFKARHVFAGMSLPAKGAVIGSGWLFSYGVFQLLEDFV